MNLKKYRENAKMTQVQIGEYLQIHQVQYNRYESEKREPPLHILWALADLYECSIDELVGRNWK